MSELVSNGVQIYQFPTEDEAVAEINSSMNVSRRNTKTHVHNTSKTCIMFIVQDNRHFHSTNVQHSYQALQPSFGIVALTGEVGHFVCICLIPDQLSFFSAIQIKTLNE